MSKETFVIVLGVWVIAVTQFGVTVGWKSIIFAITGLLVSLMGFLLRTEALARGGKTSHHHPFVENTASPDDNHTHERKEGINSFN